MLNHLVSWCCFIIVLHDLQMCIKMTYLRILISIFSLVSVGAVTTVIQETDSQNEDLLKGLLGFRVCELIPQLPSCNGSYVPGEFERDVDPSNANLVMALDYIATTQQQNEEYRKREAQNIAMIAKLELEKEQLEDQVRSLEEEWIPIVDKHPEAHGSSSSDVSTSSSNNVPDVVDQSSLRSYNHAAGLLRPVDCADHLILGAKKSGVYDIYPFKCRCSEPVRVWCDMETDGGGWTVLLKRQNHTTHVNFTRSWSAYREGFGNASTEYWLGNENLHLMTSTRSYTLRLDFQLLDGTSRWAEWAKFLVGPESDKFRLEVPSFNGQSMTDNCMATHNNRFFSTYDYDNDAISQNCAYNKKSGWWYNNCASLDPVIPFTPEGHLNTACSYKINGKRAYLAGPSMQLKIRPTICNQKVKAVLLNSYSCEGHNAL